MQTGIWAPLLQSFLCFVCYICWDSWWSLHTCETLRRLCSIDHTCNPYASLSTFIRLLCKEGCMRLHSVVLSHLREWGSTAGNSGATSALSGQLCAVVPTVMHATRSYKPNYALAPRTAYLFLFCMSHARCCSMGYVGLSHVFGRELAQPALSAF